MSSPVNPRNGAGLATSDLRPPPPVPLSGVGNMKVTNPTLTTLTVNWNPADGNVQGYKVIYAPEDGGAEVVVSSPPLRAQL